MTALSTLEAYDLLRHCATLSERIARAEVDQLSRAGLEDEKVWLHQALERVEPLLPIIEEMLGRCRELPELAPAREDHAQVVQGAWVDALERLVGGLTLHAGSRAPILETLFPHLKFPPLRRASADVVRAYAADLERRSRLGYVKRIFGAPDFAFVEPLMLAVFDRYEEWESCFAPGSLTEEEALPLREALAALTATVERDMRQARLLAEASLCPVEGAFESSGIGSRPRRRVGTVDIETPPGMDPEPVDDGVSLADALGWEGAGAPDAGAEGKAADAAREAAEGAASPENAAEAAEGAASQAHAEDDAAAAGAQENVDEDASVQANAAGEDADMVAPRESVDAGAESVEPKASDENTADGKPQTATTGDAAAHATEATQDVDAEGATHAGAPPKGTASATGKPRGKRKAKGKKAAKDTPTELEDLAASDDVKDPTAKKAAKDTPTALEDLATSDDVKAPTGKKAAKDTPAELEDLATSDDVKAPTEAQADAAPAAPATPKRSRRGRSSARAATTTTGD